MVAASAGNLQLTVFLNRAWLLLWERYHRRHPIALITRHQQDHFHDTTYFSVHLYTCQGGSLSGGMNPASNASLMPLCLANCVVPYIATFHKRKKLSSLLAIVVAATRGG